MVAIDSLYFHLGASMKDYYDQNPIILRELLGRLNDDDSAVLKSANLALAALSKHVEAEELAEYVEFMRNLLASLVSDARRRKGGVGDGEFFLPGFSMPKGKSSGPCCPWNEMKKQKGTEYLP